MYQRSPFTKDRIHRADKVSALFSNHAKQAEINIHRNEPAFSETHNKGVVTEDLHQEQ